METCNHVVWFVIATEQTCILIGSVGDSINCIADLHCDWSLQIPVVNSPTHDFDRAAI